MNSLKAVVRAFRRQFPSLWRFFIWLVYGWHFKEDCRAYGFPTAVRVVWEVFRVYVLKLPFKTTRKIRIAGYPDDVHYRPGTSDLQAIKQMLFQQFYEPIAHCDAPRFILDCGGNVGGSALYFLWKYPNTHITVVEPDPANFSVCKENLERYIRQGRVTCLQSGIWHRKTGLKLVRSTLGQEWSIEVRECSDGETADLEAIDIGTILAQSGYDTIDILKIDIEGAERRILRSDSGFESWLDRTRHLAIELHGEDCTRIFLEAMSAYDYEPKARGDVTICNNIRRKSTARTVGSSSAISTR
jgi:FkbM family methyltransferase